MEKIKNMLHLGAEKGEEKAEQKAEQHGHSTGSHSTGHHSSTTGTGYGDSSSTGRVEASGGTYEPAPTSSSTMTGGLGSSSTDNYGSSTTGSGYGQSTASKMESAIPGTSAHREREYEQGSTGLGSSSGLGGNKETYPYDGSSSTTGTGLGSSSNYGSSTTGTGSGAGYAGGSTGETIASYIPGTQANAASKEGMGSGYGSSTGQGYGSSTGQGLGSSGNTSRPRLADDNASTTSIKSGIVGTISSDRTDPLSSGSTGTGLTGSSLPDRSVGHHSGSGPEDPYHRNEVLAHHGPHTTLTARILDPATNEVPTGIYSAPDPYITTGGVASTGLSSSSGLSSSGLGSSTSGMGQQSSSGLGYSSSGHGSTVTSDPYASGSSTSRDAMSSSNMTSSTGGSHHNQGESMGQKMMDKVSGHSSTQQSGHHGVSGNDSSRDTGMSGFSTGNPNQGGDTRVPVDVPEYGGRTTDGRGNYGSENYGSSTSGSHLGDETKYNHSSGTSSTLSKIEQRLSGNSNAPSTSQGTSSQRNENSTLGGIEREVDSRIDSSGGAHVGGHSIAKGY